MERSHILSGTCYAHWLEACMTGGSGGASDWSGAGGWHADVGELEVRPPGAICFGLWLPLLGL